MALGAASGGALSLHVDEAMSASLLSGPTAGPRTVQGEGNGQATGRYCRPLLNGESMQADASERGNASAINCQEDVRLRRSLVST
jgi:hypothetical protein